MDKGKAPSAYALLLGLTGLTQQEAARFHGVPPTTLASWSSGRRTAPASAMAQLCDLVAAQEAAAARIINVMRTGERLAKPGSTATFHLGVPDSDAAAAEKGLPNVASWRAVAGRVLAVTTVPVVIGNESKG